MTLQQALLQTVASLQTREDLRENTRQDARQLLEIITGLTRVQMLASPDRLLTPAQSERLAELTRKRLQATPIQHLRGTQNFYGRDFLVTPDVLIPRPETEGIVTAVLDSVEAKSPGRHRPVRIADVGTGSGILAITLALELPRSTVLALDISPAALAVAAQNARQLAEIDQAEIPARGLTGGADTLLSRLTFAESDLLGAAAGQIFDIIVANPPYIPLTEASTLHPEVRDHEPHLALFGGIDGNDLFRRLIPQSWQHLAPGGLLILETAGRSPTLDGLLAPWQEVSWHLDLQAIDRIVLAKRT